MTTQPIVTTTINDLVVVENAQNGVFNLFNNFDDPFTTGLVARFELFDTSLGNGGITNVVLFDQDAPLSVANFRNYVNSGRYTNTIIHRSVPGFVVQGGGFTADNFPENLVQPVPTDPPVQNEFSPERSNLRGTIAFAKLGGDPDSATSQWFFNLSDNSANLDVQNGGFTVFGEVLSQADLIPVDAIAALPRFNAANINGALTEIPLILDDPANPVVNSDENLVRYRNITVSQQPELQFSVVSNSNPGLVTVNINDQGQIELDYFPGQSGTAEIVVRATNLFGDNFVEDTFVVNVSEHVDNSINGTGLPNVAVGANITGNVGNDGANFVGAADIDFHSFIPDTDGIVDISTTSGDVNLRFFNSAGEEIATDNNMVRVGVRANQEYFLGVNGNSETADNYDPLTGEGAAVGSQGDYSLSVTEFSQSRLDIDGVNGVTASDAIFTLSRLGLSREDDNFNPLADVDDNGIITPTDVISFINSLGLSDI